MSTILNSKHKFLKLTELFQHLINCDIVSIMNEWTLHGILYTNNDNKNEIDSIKFWNMIAKERNGIDEPMFPKLILFITAIITTWNSWC